MVIKRGRISFREAPSESLTMIEKNITPSYCTVINRLKTISRKSRISVGQSQKKMAKKRDIGPHYFFSLTPICTHEGVENQYFRA